jgi:FXSXX-COOH protein
MSADLPDLSGTSLAELLALDGSVLAAALERLEEELDRPAGAIAGWQSVITRPGDIPG